MLRLEFCWVVNGVPDTLRLLVVKEQKLAR